LPPRAQDRLEGPPDLPGDVPRRSRLGTGHDSWTGALHRRVPAHGVPPEARGGPSGAHHRHAHPRLPACAALRRGGRHPGQAGPHHHPGPSAPPCGPGPRIRRHRRSGPPRDLVAPGVGDLPRAPGGGSGATGNLAGRHRAQGAAPDGRRTRTITDRTTAPTEGRGEMDQSHSERPAEHRHLPVLLETSVRLLAPALQEPGAIHVDATLGMGGHASAVLRAAPHARLVGIDRDPQALELARERLHRDGVGERATLVHATYDRIPEVLEDLGLPGAHAVMMDLGLSSFQIDTPDRGFSYAVDAPLDMRMDPSSDGPTAADLLRELPEAELARILRDLGDERFAKRIARRLVAQRQQAPLTRSGELVELLEQSIPAASRTSGGHPAKRTFQALRIAVNE